MLSVSHVILSLDVFHLRYLYYFSMPHTPLSSSFNYFDIFRRRVGVRDQLLSNVFYFLITSFLSPNISSTFLEYSQTSSFLTGEVQVSHRYNEHEKLPYSNKWGLQTGQGENNSRPHSRFVSPSVYTNDEIVCRNELLYSDGWD
jgi:hypothetical protein